MIKTGYGISVKEATELNEFKKTSGYGTYLKSISLSPAYRTIMEEHINNVNISEDVKKLKIEGKLPDTVSDKSLCDLFKQSLSRMAICITADAIILKELENIKIEEVMTEIRSDTDIIYLLGKADKKYYIQAKKLLEDGKLDKDTIAFKGLVTYLKQSGELNVKEDDGVPIEKVLTPAKKEPKKKINIDSSSIDL